MPMKLHWRALSISCPTLGVFYCQGPPNLTFVFCIVSMIAAIDFGWPHYWVGWCVAFSHIGLLTRFWQGCTRPLALRVAKSSWVMGGKKWTSTSILFLGNKPPHIQNNVFVVNGTYVHFLIKGSLDCNQRIVLGDRDQNTMSLVQCLCRIWY